MDNFSSIFLITDNEFSVLSVQTRISLRPGKTIPEDGILPEDRENRPRDVWYSLQGNNMGQFSKARLLDPSRLPRALSYLLLLMHILNIVVKLDIWPLFAAP